MNIVFIHGYCDSLHEFDHLKKYFSQTQTFDLPGFGQNANQTLKQHKKNFLESVKKRVTKPSILVGFSMGAMIARDFALTYPHLVKKLFLISYAPQKSRKRLREALRKRWLTRQYVDRTLGGKLLCKNHHTYRWIALLHALIFRPSYYNYVNGYFQHSYDTALSTMQEYILEDDPESTLLVKEKAVLIVGEREPLLEDSLLSRYKHYKVKGMKHTMAGHENKMAKIIKENI